MKNKPNKITAEIKIYFASSITVKYFVKYFLTNYNKSLVLTCLCNMKVISYKKRAEHILVLYGSLLYVRACVRVMQRARTHAEYILSYNS